jgi:hypothetical protein
MAKEKNSPGGSVPGKAAAVKKKPGPGKVAAQKPEKAVAAAAAASSSASAHRGQPSEAEIYQEISLRAFEFFCERGGHHGSHEADWHRAELEVRARYTRY